MRFFKFSNLSLKQRLPVLIFSLLFAFIVCFSWVSYLGVKDASLFIGKQRLSTLTDQLGAMFGQSVSAFTLSTEKAASGDTIKRYLLSGKNAGKAEALKALDKLRQDTLTLYVQLIDTQRNVVLASSKNNIQINISPDSVLASYFSPSGHAAFGKIYPVGDSMYYPVVATVTNNARAIGYLIRWRLFTATSRSITMLSQLMGTNAALYFGNDDGKFWTDMMKPVAAPPVDMQDIRKIIQFSPQKGDPQLASAQKVPNSRWLILVKFSQDQILETSRLFLRWIIVIGLALSAAGSFITWLLSRNITKPLKNLTHAAANIAAGHYDSPVATGRNDEFEALARAFNSMAVQIKNAQQDLEKKVQDRTFELQRANKEMESFSYTVSHDLHAPLRIIQNYASMLSSKASDKEDVESTRILKRITDKAHYMGTLIDELLKLSLLGRKELTIEMTDMDGLVRLEMEEQLLLHPSPMAITINELLPAKCDEGLMRQVWGNLISNAFKYSAKKEHPCVEIDSYKDMDMIVYSIQDNGVGFDMKYSEKLFGVFQRLHDKREFEGSGVGLALVQRVIAKHGGSVWAQAEEGKGAKFYFSLPG